MAVSFPYMLATPNTDVILKMLPAIAKGIDDKTIANFPVIEMSKMKAYMTDKVNKDMIDLNPLHSNATSKEPFGVFNIRPSRITGIPKVLANPDDATAETVCAGGAIKSTKGTGIASNKNNNGNRSLLANFHPYMYITIPYIATIKDNPDKNLAT